MECDCDININKLDLTEADQVSDYIREFKINLYRLKLLVSQKNYTSSINVYFSIATGEISHSKALVAVSEVC